MASILKRNKLQVWRDVIFALFIREIRTGFNDKFGISWAIINPLSFIFALSYIRGLIEGGETHGMPTFVFMVHGMVLVQLFLTLMESTSTSLNKNKSLFAFRQVQPISAYLATALFEILVKLFVVFVLIVLMYFLNIDIRGDNLLILISCFFLLAVIACSVGIVFSMIQGFIPEFGRIRTVFTRPLFFISAVFFSLQDFGPEVWPYLNWNPILQAIELSRQAAYSNYGAVAVSFKYLCAMAVLSVFVALSVYTISWKQVISR
ncbi:ABC transporter permease [Photobacterium sp. TLY01]|uniref:ABC transporter permease n=1 Tax=Photobacterium sp. TLY01 TaxID=2907534 RepID=UPI001F1A9202|nr:ABC transporter permease [Photobacterium sp. TLY01]UIP27220.1 ABC transporter permease [Photobacterium sp. TLY01]